MLHIHLLQKAALVLNAVALLKHHVYFVHLQTAENARIKTHIQNYSGVCLHNGIRYKDKDEWTVDSCTHCTCQVSLQLYLNEIIADTPIKYILLVLISVS